jgi:hypothetical protein
MLEFNAFGHRKKYPRVANRDLPSPSRSSITPSSFASDPLRRRRTCDSFPLLAALRATPCALYCGVEAGHDVQRAGGPDAQRIPMSSSLSQATCSTKTLGHTSCWSCVREVAQTKPLRTCAYSFSGVTGKTPVGHGVIARGQPRVGQRPTR